jgi:Kelch motif/F-box domain
MDSVMSEHVIESQVTSAVTVTVTVTCSIDALSEDLLRYCLSFLTGAEVAITATVNKSWHTALNVPDFWRDRLNDEFSGGNLAVTPAMITRSSGPAAVEIQYESDVLIIPDTVPWRQLYAKNFRMSTLRQVRWRKIPQSVAMGSWEGHRTVMVRIDGMKFMSIVYGWNDQIGPCRGVLACQLTDDIKSVSWHRVPRSGVDFPGVYGHSVTSISDTEAFIFGGFLRGGYGGPTSEARLLTFRRKNDDAMDIDPTATATATATATVTAGLGTSSSTGEDFEIEVELQNIAQQQDVQPVAVAYHGAVFVPPTTVTDTSRGCVFVFGGNTTNRLPSNALYCFDVASRKWSQPDTKGTEPCARNGCSMSYIDGKIYVCGGGDGRDVPRSGTDFCDMHALDLQTMQWHDISVPPIERLNLGRCHSATVVGKSIVFFGGSNHVCNFTSVFHVPAREWFTPQEQSGTGPRGRLDHACVFDDNRILVCGGFSARHRAMDDMWVLDLAATSRNSSGQGQGQGQGKDNSDDEKMDTFQPDVLDDEEHQAFSNRNENLGHMVDFQMYLQMLLSSGQLAQFVHGDGDDDDDDNDADDGDWEPEME